MKRWGLILAFLLLAARAQAQIVPGGGGSSGGGTNITAGAGDFSACTQTGATLNCTVVNSQGNALTGSTFGATLNLSTLLSQDCTVSGAGVVTCTKAGNGTGTFKAGSIGVNATPPATAGQMLLKQGSGNLTFLNFFPGSGDFVGFSGVAAPGATTYAVMQGPNGDTYVNAATGQVLHMRINNGSDLFNVAAAGDSIGSDNAVNTMARMPLSFSEGSDTSLVANESLGTFLTPKAITIENIILDIKEPPTCSVSEQITCYDCGTSAGACTSGQTATIMSAVTIATGATRQSISETVNTANVAAAHYISCLITAGACTFSNNAISMMARPQ